jgi:hypothetical protein
VIEFGADRLGIAHPDRSRIPGQRPKMPMRQARDCRG